MFFKFHILNTDEIKQKVETKFNELGDMCERGEMEPEQAYDLFKEFEDKMVAECTELMEEEMPTDADELTETGSKKIEVDDPPGDGPVLRWESRIVFAHGMLYVGCVKLLERGIILGKMSSQ
jgi:small subunit ribosomal protein S35